MPFIIGVCVQFRNNVHIIPCMGLLPKSKFERSVGLSVFAQTVIIRLRVSNGGFGRSPDCVDEVTFLSCDFILILGVTKSCER